MPIPAPTAIATGTSPAFERPLEVRREQQAEVTERLTEQIFAALQILLEDLEATTPTYADLLEIVLRSMFTLYAQARGLSPVARVAEIDDDTRDRMLDAMLYVHDGQTRQRLCYRSLDVEQLGGVYAALMGYEVIRLPAPAVRLRAGRAKSVWLSAASVLATAPMHRVRWLERSVGLDKATAKRVALAVAAAIEGVELDRQEDAVLDQLERLAGGGHGQRASGGRLVIQPGDERRRTSSHYTPRTLTEPLVRRTLAPILRALGAKAGGLPSSAALLELKIVDPAMGCGAFLLEVVRQLADHLVAAWAREGHEVDDPPIAARRLVAQRCVYGVDKNPSAVELAKLSLWLVIGCSALPLSAFDHGLRCGDSLVGLSLTQSRAFHWIAESGVDEPWLREIVAVDDARLVADLCIGAFFAGTGPNARNAERRRRLHRLKQWRVHGHDRKPLDSLREQLRSEQAPFHWAIEFPEVIHFDAVVGNPPFMGGRGVTAQLGKTYSDWLEWSEGGSAAADLSARFFTRARSLIGPHGTLGLVVTNTIGQGDTRACGLAALLADGVQIYDATIDLQWPAPGAAVTVAIIHAAIGDAREHTDPPVLRKPDPATGKLHAHTAKYINSRLAPRPERADPIGLTSNEDLAFQGSIVLGEGFILSPDQRDALVCRDPRNAERIKPYLGGAEVNRNPDQSFARYVIDFVDLPRAQAERWPDLFAHLHRKVQPERARKDGRRYPRMVNEWWKHWNARPALYAALSQVSRCLVTARLTKHLCFSWQPSGTVFSEQLIIVAQESVTLLAILQSRVHERWARTLGSSLETRLRYTPSDCLQNFPFPAPDPRTKHAALEQLGDELDRLRREFMLAEQLGLTPTYNRLLGWTPATDPRIASLRALHLELDRAVLATYAGQLDASDDPRERELAPRFAAIEVPPYRDPRLPDRSPADRRALDRFNDAILDALMALNEVRVAQQLSRRTS